MNFFKGRNLIAVVLVTLAAVTVSFAQDQQDQQNQQQNQGEQKKEADVVKNRDGSYSTTRFDEADRPDDSYLAKDHAFNIVPYQQRQNLDYLYRARIIITNFSDQGWDEDYQKCYDGYKKAMEYYYRKNYIYARLDFDNNLRDLNELMRKASEFFREQDLELLDECVDLVLTAHMDLTRRADPEKNAALFTAQNRLRIAYNLLDLAETMMIDKKYYGAVIQLRMSRAYCIKIIEDFAKPDQAEEMKERFKIMKADNMNRMYKPAPEKVPVTDEE